MSCGSVEGPAAQLARVHPPTSVIDHATVGGAGVAAFAGTVGCITATGAAAAGGVGDEPVESVDRLAGHRPTGVGELAERPCGGAWVTSS